jgi:hypothetical protein
MILYIFPKNPPSGDIWHMHNRTRSRSLSKLHDGRKTLDWPALITLYGGNSNGSMHIRPSIIVIYICMPARWLALGHQVVDRLLQTVRYSTVRQLICWLVCSFFFNVPTSIHQKPRDTHMAPSSRSRVHLFAILLLVVAMGAAAGTFDRCAPDNNDIALSLSYISYYLRP